MEQVLQLAVVVFAALATGGLMVNWIGLGRAMSRISASSYVEFHQATNHTFNPYMPIVVVGAILGGIVLAIPGCATPRLSISLILKYFSTSCKSRRVARVKTVPKPRRKAWTVPKP